MSLVDISDPITNTSPVDQQEMSSLPPAQIQDYEQLPKAPPGMRYVLVPEQQTSLISSQPIPQAQQQQIGGSRCYMCGDIAIARCFYGTNSIHHCRYMMCLQHAESILQGYPLRTCYFCQGHYQICMAERNQICFNCSIL